MSWEVLNDQFMRHAILATLLAGITCPIVGVFILTLRLTFMGVCMSHVALAGALVGILVGINPLLTALTASLVAAAALGPIADRGDLSPDTAMGILFSAALGLVFLLMALLPGPKSEALNLLWGSVLTVTRQNLYLLAGLAFGIWCALALFFKEVQAVIFHRELAAASGIPATAVLYGILFCSGAVITASLNAIGGLLVFSLIVNPAAAAYQLTYNLKRMLWLSAGLGVLSGWGGLALSCLFNLPSGALIVLASTLLFGVALLTSPKRLPLKKGIPPMPRSAHEP